MPDLEAQSFTIRCPLDRPASDFEAEVPGTQAFVQASEADRISLEAGYRDAAGQETMVGQIRKGIVDEWELTLAPTTASTLVRGRDPMDRLLSRSITKLYPRAPAPAAPADTGPIPTLTIAQAPPGHWRASQIAADVVATVNAALPSDQQLALSWETRDYEKRADFSASGRPLDVLRELAEPWNQVPAFSIDVFMAGLTIVVRNRMPVPAPDHVLALPDARIRQLTITKRRPELYGRVILSGMRLGDDPTVPTDPTVDIEDTPNRTEATVATAAGTFRYRLPDGVLLHAAKPVFAANTRPGGGEAAELIKRETIANVWAPATEQGRTGPPRQLSQHTLVEGVHPKDKTARIFRILGDEAVVYAYDTQDFLVKVTATKREVPHKAPDTFEVKEQVTKDYTDVSTAPPMHEIVTTAWRWENKAGIWLITNRDAVTVSGYRPGGPAGFKGLFIPADQGVSNGQEPVVVDQVISLDPDAQAFTYENADLTRADLLFILSHLQAASGLWPYELSFPGVTMPWIKKGVGIQFTACRDADDALIEFHAGLPAGHLYPALITETALRYVEGAAENSSILESQARGLYWSTD